MPLFTNLHGIWATGTVATTSWGRKQIRRTTFNRFQLVLLTRIVGGHRFLQPQGIGMGGLIENVAYCPMLYDFACIHYSDLISHACHYS